MSPETFSIRRATVDDLRALQTLWREMRFRADELERRPTDFQVAVDGRGDVLGAVALEIAGSQARIHHEAFHDFGLADALRPLFWKSFQALAASHGLFRLWTQEDAPFWKQAGLQPASKELLQTIPAKWSNDRGGWLTLALKDEAAIAALTADTELDVLMKIRREESSRTLARVDLLKKAAMVVALIFSLLVAAMILFMVRRDPALLQGFFRR